MTSEGPSSIMDLLDWRRRVADLYAAVRSTEDPERAWRLWRHRRDVLFKQHPESPITLDRRQGFPGSPFYDYDPAARVLGRVEWAEHDVLTIATSDGNTMSMTRFARVTFELYGGTYGLDAFWLAGYAGGLFLPFGDTTNRTETYGAGRYLLDTAKGADLGSEDGALVLDFNFAYNPSCSYDAKWACPLAPPANRMSVDVRAGECII